MELLGHLHDTSRGISNGADAILHSDHMWMVCCNLQSWSETFKVPWCKISQSGHEKAWNVNPLQFLAYRSDLAASHDRLSGLKLHLQGRSPKTTLPSLQDTRDGLNTLVIGRHILASPHSIFWKFSKTRAPAGIYHLLSGNADNVNRRAELSTIMQETLELVLHI